MERNDQRLFEKGLRSVAYTLAALFPVGLQNGLEAAGVCRVLAGHGIPSTVGKLSKSGDDPERTVGDYLLASNSLRSGAPSERFYLSVKPPALDFSPKHAARIVAAARENGQGVHFDAHGFRHADATFALLESVMQRHPGSPPPSRWEFGVTLPSRWKRSEGDARWVAGKGLRPRVVKGDFRAPPSEEVEPVQGFLALVDLLAGEVPEVALATHDPALAREAVLRCRRRGSAVQLELFFGMPSGAMLVLARELEVAVRFYVPFGEALLLYVVRDLLSNPHKILRPSSYELVASRRAKLARIIGSP